MEECPRTSDPAAVRYGNQTEFSGPHATASISSDRGQPCHVEDPNNASDMSRFHILVTRQGVQAKSFLATVGLSLRQTTHKNLAQAKGYVRGRFPNLAISGNSPRVFHVKRKKTRPHRFRLLMRGRPDCYGPSVPGSRLVRCIEFAGNPRPYCKQRTSRQTYRQRDRTVARRQKLLDRSARSHHP